MPTAAYCPGLDEEVSGWFDKMVDNNLVKKENLHAGGGRSLDKVAPTDKLYIVCHGHAQLPLFCTQAGKWTAEDMVNLLTTDGLSPAHRLIEMLVCHAGESVVSTRDFKVRMPLYLRLKAAQVKNDDRTVQQLRKKLQRASEKGSTPEFFTHKDDVLPLCAQLIDLLKKKGFNHIQVVAYKCPVATLFYMGEIHLNLKGKPEGQNGVRASDYPQYRVVWM